MRPLRHEDDLRPAEGVAKLLDAAGDSVTSVIPPGYESYVRILNPIELSDGSTASWTEVVARNGIEPRAWMQWPEFAAVDGVVLPDGWREPDMGNPPVSLAKRLIEALKPDQSTHYFASWAGYAGEIQGPAVMFSPYQREMVLYSGSLVDEHRALRLPTTATGRVPMYWWPSDLRWFVGQDIYARSLFVGCTQSTAQTILEDPNLDAYPISPSDAVTNEEF
ncbi:hypothetical protein [Homoserinimonas sp. A520]